LQEIHDKAYEALQENPEDQGLQKIYESAKDALISGNVNGGSAPAKMKSGGKVGMRSAHTCGCGK
jgi:hypothetical protein